MRSLAVLGVAVWLNACTAGPDYVRSPEAAINNAKVDFAESSGPAFSHAEPPRQWWRLYDDPVLDQIIVQALAQNSDIRIAAANIKQADAYKAEIADKQGLQTQIGGNAGYGQMSAEEHLIIGQSLASDYMYSLEAGLSYPLDLAGQIKRAIEVANAEGEARRYAFDRVRIGVVAEVSRAYLDICAAGRDTELAEAMVHVQEQLKTTNDRLIANGKAAAISDRGFEAQLWRTKAAVPELLARKKAAFYRLAALLGQRPEQLPQSVMICRRVPMLKVQIPTGDGRAFLDRRPDIREAEANLKAASARIGVAEGDLYPHIAIGLSAGSVGLLRHVGDADTYKYSLGPLISWDFPARGAVRARIAEVKAGDEAALAAFDRAVLFALRDAETSLSHYSRDLDQNSALKHVATDRGQSRDDSEKFLANGRQNLMAVLTARYSHLQAEQELASSEAKLAADQVTLFWVLGGGW